MSKTAIKLPIPHDSYFRTCMANPDIAIPFCKTHIDKSLSSKIDYTTMRIVNRSFLTKALRNCASDVVLEFDLVNPQNSPTQTSENKQVSIAILIEHQSTPDKLMAFRVFHYLFNYLNEQLKQQKSDKHLLPPVYPLVFYNGTQTPYPYKLDLFECFADPYQVMKRVLIDEIKLIDVNQLSETELKTQDFLGLMTRAMKFRNITEQTIDYLKALFIDLHLLLEGCDDKNILKVKDYIQTSITYLAAISDIDDFRQAIVENTQIPETTRGDFMTAAEYYIQQGEALGEARGEARGEAKGEARGKSEVAVNALKKGFAVEMVVDLTGLTVEKVKQLKRNINAGK